MAIDFTCQTLKSKCNRKAKRKKEKKTDEDKFCRKDPPFLYRELINMTVPRCLSILLT